jgi:fructokinase
MKKCLIAMGELIIDKIKLISVKYPVDEYQSYPGGAPANVAYCVAKLGGSSLYLSQVGDDQEGHFLVDTMKTAPMDVQHIRFSKDYTTSIAYVHVLEHGEREFTFKREHAADLYYQAEDIDEKIFENASILHFGSVNLVPSPAKIAHMKAIELAQKNQMMISFDPNLRLSLWKNQDDLINTVQAFIPLVHLLKVSSEELLLLSNETDENLAVKSLFQGSVQWIIVTKGSLGATLYSKFDSISVPASSTKAIDTTGAGDAFMGGFLYRMLQREHYPLKARNYEDDLIFAACVASIVVERVGAMLAMPMLAEVKKRSEDCASLLIR